MLYLCEKHIDMKQKIFLEDFMKYYEEGLNDTQISLKLNCHNAAITIFRNKLGLKPNFVYPRDVSQEEFLPLYEQGLDDAKIARILNKSHKGVTYTRQTLGLPMAQCTINPTPFQEEVLLGTLLGDGHLSLKWRNADGDYAHSLRQKDYALYKYDILKEFCKPVRYDYFIDKRTLKEYSRIHVRFKANSYLTSIYPYLYENKKKYISEFIMNKLTYQMFAIWFMDDGYINSNNAHSLSTNCFTEKDLQIAQHYFKEKLGLECTIPKSHVLYFGTKNNEIFEEKIRPLILQSLQYKI